MTYDLRSQPESHRRTPAEIGEDLSNPNRTEVQEANAIVALNDLISNDPNNCQYLIDIVLDFEIKHQRNQDLLHDFADRFFQSMLDNNLGLPVVVLMKLRDILVNSQRHQKKVKALDELLAKYAPYSYTVHLNKAPYDPTNIVSKHDHDLRKKRAYEATTAYIRASGDKSALGPNKGINPTALQQHSLIPVAFLDFVACLEAEGDHVAALHCLVAMGETIRQKGVDMYADLLSHIERLSWMCLRDPRLSDKREQYSLVLQQMDARFSALGQSAPQFRSTFACLRRRHKGGFDSGGLPAPHVFRVEHVVAELRARIGTPKN